MIGPKESFRFNSGAYKPSREMPKTATRSEATALIVSSRPLLTHHFSTMLIVYHKEQFQLPYSERHQAAAQYATPARTLAYQSLQAHGGHKRLLSYGTQNTRPSNATRQQNAES